MNDDDLGLGLAAVLLIVIVSILLIGLFNLVYSLGVLIWG